MLRLPWGWNHLQMVWVNNWDMTQNSRTTISLELRTYREACCDGMCGCMCKAKVTRRARHCSLLKKCKAPCAVWYQIWSKNAYATSVRYISMWEVQYGSILDAVLQSSEEFFWLRVRRDEQGRTGGNRGEGYWSPAPVVYGKVNRKLS